MIVEKLKELIVKCKDGVEFESLHDQTNLITDLSFNSIDLIQFIVEVEEAFDVEIDNDDLDKDKIVVLGELVEIISNLKG